ncbi:MAG: hypothetical protein LH702_14760 [Phormidesmis sp. CAN_BIN44]|nr:hypothetical protein [Phormidesmis sp. CAN_BIN44]
MLRHVRHGSLYWFCRTCWSEMPDLNYSVARSLPPKVLLESSYLLHR